VRAPQFWIALLSVASAVEMPALLVAEFPGIENIIEYSDAIAIVAVQRDEGVASVEPYCMYRVRVEKSLKGDLPESKEISIGIFSLPLGKLRELKKSYYMEFTTGTRQLVFLKEPDRDRGGLMPFYCNLGYEGSHITLSPTTKVGVLSATNLPATIRFLLKESMEFERDQHESLQKELREILGEKERTKGSS
jgi:hypothetical protein